MARSKSIPGDENASPTFEESLASLEAIVESMERENLPLEDLVSQYEKGSVLLTRCEALLQSARGRIELITLRNQKEIALDDAVKTDEAARNALPDDPDDDDDIRLF